MTSKNLQIYVSSYLGQNLQQSGMAETKVHILWIRGSSYEFFTDLNKVLIIHTIVGVFLWMLGLD